MTESKPAQLAKLIKGKTLYCVDNFCATLNWLISCWGNVKAEYGVKISGVEGGAPIIEADLEAGAGVTIEPSRGNPTKIAANLTAGDGVTVAEDSDGAVGIAANLTAGDGVTLETQSDGAIKITAEGGSLTLASGDNSVSGVRKVVLKSGTDSNVVFGLTEGDDGLVTVAVDVYYR